MRRQRGAWFKRTLFPALPFLGVHAACGLVVLFPPTRELLVLAASGYVIRMWAVTAGYHRYFAHRAYKTSRTFQLVLAVLAGTAMQQGPLWWASWHRRHHKYTDAPGDPHSPTRDGFWHAHVGWIFDGDHYSTDLSSVRDLARFTSRNNALLAVLTFGEGWHNNHHHYMTATRQGFRWWEIDLTYYSLKLLATLGIVWDLRQPPDRRDDRHLLNRAQDPAPW